MHIIYVRGLKSTLHVQCQGATAIVSWMESQSSLDLCTATPTSDCVPRPQRNMSCIFTFIIHSSAFLVTRADVAQGKVLLCLRYTPLSNYLLSSQLLFFALQEFSNFVNAHIRLMTIYPMPSALNLDNAAIARPILFLLLQ